MPITLLANLSKLVFSRFHSSERVIGRRKNGSSANFLRSLSACQTGERKYTEVINRTAVTPHPRSPALSQNAHQFFQPETFLIIKPEMEFSMCMATSENVIIFCLGWKFETCVEFNAQLVTYNVVVKIHLF